MVNMFEFHTLMDWVILLLSVAVLVWNMSIWFKRRKNWFFVMPMVVWALHLGVFYTVALVGRLGVYIPLGDEFLHNWSVVLRFHSVFTMLWVTYLISWACRRHGRHDGK